MAIFNGKQFAAKKEAVLKAKVAVLKQKGQTPKLVSFLAGENPESELYTRLKKEAAGRIGIDFEVKKFTDSVAPEEFIREIEKVNQDTSVQGIMVQLPLPKKFEIRNSKFEILGAIAPSKDVDGLTPENLGLVMLEKPRFLPATVKAVMEIIKGVILGSEATPESDPGQVRTMDPGQARMTDGKWLKGESVCLVGASEMVGKPLAMILSAAGATVTLCRSTTKNLAEFTRQADILISATGVPGLIKKEMVKEKAIVVDVGIKKVEGRILGDVEKEVAGVASFMTPVPGGVGPVTVVSLLENLVETISSS